MMLRSVQPTVSLEKTRDPQPFAAERASVPAFVRELYAETDAAAIGWTLEDFAAMIAAAAERRPADMQAETYVRSLHCGELALARGCAHGFAAAWQRFVETYRAPLRQAAIAITQSVALGEEMADSLYAELFGLRTREGERQSPLLSYSGRGSLMGWLRTTLAQRHVDRFRRTRREAPLDKEYVAPQEVPAVEVQELAPLEAAVRATLRTLAAEERFLLAAYFLDGRTLLEIARLLHVHEATVSRKLKRLLESVRKQLLRDLERRGLSRAAARETLGTDPRDLDVSLQKILQKGADPPFPERSP